MNQNINAQTPGTVTHISQAYAASGGQSSSRRPIVSGTGGSGGGGSVHTLETLSSRIDNIWKVFAGAALVVIGAFGGVLYWADQKFESVDAKFDRVDDRFNDVNQTLIGITSQLSEIQTNQNWIITELRDRQTPPDPPAKEK